MWFLAIQRLLFLYHSCPQNNLQHAVHSVVGHLHLHYVFRMLMPSNDNDKCTTINMDMLRRGKGKGMEWNTKHYKCYVFLGIYLTGHLYVLIEIDSYRYMAI